MSDKALLTINVSDPLRITQGGFLSENSRQSFKDACRRWDCDYVEYTTVGGHHPAFFKLKAFDLCPHDRIMVLDADTIVRDDTPSPFDMTDPEYFHASQNEQEHQAPHVRRIHQQMALESLKSILTTKPIESLVDADYIKENFFNSGMLIISREYHQPVMSLAWYLNEYVTSNWLDQLPLNLAVFAFLGGYVDMGPAWNYQIPQDYKNMNAYIYHFSGDPRRYDLLNTVNWHVERVT